jgi:membrane protein implicated in regulation of membrane protease activity
MHDGRFIAKYFGPLLFLTYVALTAMVVFALNIALAVKLTVVVVAAVVFAGVLKPGAHDAPPFGTETDDEATLRRKDAHGHSMPTKNSPG